MKECMHIASIFLSRYGHDISDMIIRKHLSEMAGAFSLPGMQSEGPVDFPSVCQSISSCEMNSIIQECVVKLQKHHDLRSILRNKYKNANFPYSIIKTGQGKSKTSRRSKKKN